MYINKICENDSCETLLMMQLKISFVQKNGITLVRMNTDLFINDSYIRTTLSEAIEKATLKLESTIERATTNG